MPVTSTLVSLPASKSSRSLASLRSLRNLLLPPLYSRRESTKPKQWCSPINNKYSRISRNKRRAFTGHTHRLRHSLWYSLNLNFHSHKVFSSRIYHHPVQLIFHNRALEWLIWIDQCTFYLHYLQDNSIWINSRIMSKFRQWLKILLYIAELFPQIIQHMEHLEVCKAPPPRVFPRTFPFSPSLCPTPNHLKIFPLEIKIQVVLQLLSMGILDFKTWLEGNILNNLNPSLAPPTSRATFLMPVLSSTNNTPTLKAALHMNLKKMKAPSTTATLNLLKDWWTKTNLITTLTLWVTNPCIPLHKIPFQVSVSQSPVSNTATAKSSPSLGPR